MDMKKQLSALHTAKVSLEAHNETLAPVMGPFGAMTGAFYGKVNQAERYMVLALTISHMQKVIQSYTLEKLAKEDPAGLKLQELRSLESMLVKYLRDLNLSGDLGKMARDLINADQQEGEE